MSIKSVRKYLILPICMLLLNAAEEVIVYKLQRLKDLERISKITLTIILLVMFAAGFALVGDFLVPYIKVIMEKTHKGTKKTGGSLGIILFYSAIFWGIFILYYVIYCKGAEYLLPEQWR